MKKLLASPHTLSVIHSFTNEMLLHTSTYQKRKTLNGIPTVHKCALSKVIALSDGARVA